MGHDSSPSLSPLDGRYAQTTSVLVSYFSEDTFLAERAEIEIKYLKFLSFQKLAPALSIAQNKRLDQIAHFSPTDTQQIKTIEQQTHHDVKAIEYFLQQKLTQAKLQPLIPFIHFGLTSEDVNNLAYRRLVQAAQQQVILPKLRAVLTSLNQLVEQSSSLVMLARTHGQPAVPTTLGKELSVFCVRILEQLQAIEAVALTGKLNGAVGGFQALAFTFPQQNWLKLSRQFVESLDLKYKLHTTQINQADDLVDLFAHYHHLNTILLDFNQDIWRYISDDWLSQKGKNQTVGSSTMPQKINPIEFENSEGNLTIANSLIEGFNRKLPISRLQRDLSDSTVMRNLGVVFGHCLVAYHSLTRGLSTIAANPAAIKADLHANWNILAEAMNVEGRLQQDNQAYEQAAQAFKGKQINQTQWQQLTRPISSRLAKLTPETYLGLTENITHQAIITVKKYLKQTPPTAGQGRQP